MLNLDKFHSLMYVLQLAVNQTSTLHLSSWSLEPEHAAWITNYMAHDSMDSCHPIISNTGNALIHDEQIKCDTINSQLVLWFKYLTVTHLVPFYHREWFNKEKEKQMHLIVSTI